MMFFVLGLILSLIAVGSFVLLRGRNGEPHPLLHNPGMLMITPVVLLAILVLGIAFVVHGGSDVWRNISPQGARTGATFPDLVSPHQAASPSRSMRHSKSRREVAS